MRLHIVSAALPPKLDGIGDYTSCLAKELSTHHEVSILTDRDAVSSPIRGVVIEPCFSPAHRGSTRAILTHARREQPEWLILQYNPFAFGRRGFNLHLPLVMRAIRRELPDTHVAIMCHEVFTPVIDLKFAVMTTWQRAQLFALGRTADCIFLSIEAWKRRLAWWFPRTPLVHLPVGSNVPVAEINSVEARSRLGIDPEQVVLGVFGTAHPSRMLRLMRDAAERVRAAGHNAVVLYVGPDDALVKRVLNGIPMIAAGRVSATEVSWRFAAMDLYLAAFLDGVSTRRTTLMTGLQHGIPTIGTSGELTDGVLRAAHDDALVLVDVATPEHFAHAALRLLGDPELRDRIGARGRELYEREFDWPGIARRLVATLSDINGHTNSAS